MKKVINTLFVLLIMGIAVIFAINYIFNGPIAGGNGIFQGIGNVLNVTYDDKTSTLPSINGSSSLRTAPVMKYSAVPYNTGGYVIFKSLFNVITENGEKNGTVEDDFTIYLSDIRSSADVSVVEFLTSEQINSLEEIPAAFLYDTQTDMLYFCQGGIYTVYVKIYGSNGTQAEYEFLMPVEIN